MTIYGVVGFGNGIMFTDIYSSIEEAEAKAKEFLDGLCKEDAKKWDIYAAYHEVEADDRRLLVDDFCYDGDEVDLDNLDDIQKKCILSVAFDYTWIHRSL